MDFMQVYLWITIVTGFLCVSNVADSSEFERNISDKLFQILRIHREAPVCHYRSYESQALKQAVKNGPKLSKSDLKPEQMPGIDSQSLSVPKPVG